MLSPYVGLSHFVWTAQNRSDLVALACGYYAGGRLADRSPNLSWLYWAILMAAGYLAFTVMICERSLIGAGFQAGDWFAVGIDDSLFYSLALMAMTAPFLVRMITSSVAGVGVQRGRLTSVSTIGSFVAQC
jgi:hypothetical protein